MRGWLVFIGLVALPFSSSEERCQGLGHTGKKIFCYLEGKRSPHELDPCACTHLLIKNQQIDVYSSLILEQGTESDIAALRSMNPELEILISVGGDAVNGDTFRSIVSNKKMLTNFTNSVNSMYAAGTIQGLELDWEWPMSSSDKKDKIKLIRYMRQLKLATGATNIRRRLRRSEATTTSEPVVETTTTDDVESTTFDLISASEEEESPQSTTLGDDLESVTTELNAAFETTTTANEDETTFNWRARGVVRRRKKVQTTTTTPEPTDSTEDPRLTLEDVLFNETEDPDTADPEGFVLVLRLSPEPFHLVKGYEFKMLNKFVDYFTLPSYNITRDTTNLTYHHSRLMGVSDIQNTDALIDVVVGLGAPVHKLVMTVPAFGNTFNLMDPERNLPGSAVTGPPTTITYQQVCQLLSRGNWTLEREEDLTGPYSYLGSKWMAFDDDTSLRIKAKYVLLREMAGIGLVSIDADDIDDVCGKGGSSLLNTLGGVMRNLQRQPRQLIITSLEQDLLATANTFLPVSEANGLRVSPFRIVRIVDREGEIQSIRENSETILECSRQGYYRHPEDCSRFYRCVKFNQYEDDYTIFEYGCPNGLVFDDRWEVCVWPSQATPCDGSSEIFPIPKNEYVCPGEGFFVDPENCRWFFACRDHLGDGTYTHYEFRCPFGLAFDEVNLRCEWPWLVSACANQGEYSVGGASPLPTRKDFIDNYRPAGTSSPFPAVPTIPNFESSRTPEPAASASFGIAPGDIISEGCENCYSPVLTITGSGLDNGKGIEVAAGPIVAGSDAHNVNAPFTQSLGQFKQPQPSGYRPTQAAYRPTTAQQAYQPTQAAYRPAEAQPAYQPTQPAYRPTTAQPAYKPTTARPTYRPTTARPTPTVTYTTTALPVYSTSTEPAYNPSVRPTTQAPSQGYAASSPGYDYPVPQNPLKFGISVSNPGENGLISSPAAAPPAPAVSPNLPAYGVSPTYSTTAAPVTPTYVTPSTSYSPVSSTFGASAPSGSYVSSTPSYGGGISSTYNPSVNTYKPVTYSPIKNTYQPGVSSTLAPLVSSTYAPKAPTTTYAPRIPSTTYAPKVPSTTYAPKVPASTYSPVVSTTFSSPVVSTSYKPVVSSIYSPKPTVGYVVEAEAPLETYGVPYAPVQTSYVEPADEKYPAPQQEYGYQPQYQEPEESYSLNSPQYENPSNEGGYKYPVPSNPLQLPAKKPVTPTYSSPSPKPFVHFGSPPQPAVVYVSSPAPTQKPAASYGSPTPSYASPKPSFVSTTPTYGIEAEKPSETYGVPAAPVISAYNPTTLKAPVTIVSTTYRPSTTKIPAVSAPETYGVPLAPVLSTAYEPSAQEIPLPNYGSSGDSSAASRPASLPDNWPSYPSAEQEYNPQPVTVKQLPTQPKITYGAFKPPSVPEPPRKVPQYQQPSYNNYPSQPEIIYGDFKGIPASLPTGSNSYRPRPQATEQFVSSSDPEGYSYPVPQNPLQYPTTRKPTQSPTTPNIPAYGPTTVKSLPSAAPGYSYPVPQNPLVYPSSPKPIYNTTPKPATYAPTLHASVTAAYDQTPRAPVFVSTPASVAPIQASPTPSAGYSYPKPANPLQYPTKKPERLPSYNSPTPKPFVDFGAPAQQASYPAGAQGSKPVVASVIPTGFTSATLSNGPYSSLPSGNIVDIDNKPGKLKPFVHTGSSDTYGSSSASLSQYNEPPQDLPSYGASSADSGRDGKTFGNNNGKLRENNFASINRGKGLGGKGLGLNPVNGAFNANLDVIGNPGAGVPKQTTVFGANNGNAGLAGSTGNRGKAAPGFGGTGSFGSGASRDNVNSGSRGNGNGFGPGSNGGFGGRPSGNLVASGFGSGANGRNPGSRGSGDGTGSGNRGFAGNGASQGFGNGANQGFGNGGFRGNSDNGGFEGNSGSGGFGGNAGNGGSGGNPGSGGFGGNPGNRGFGGNPGNGGFRGNPGNGGFGGNQGNGGNPGNRGFGGSPGNGGSRGNSGNRGLGGNTGNGGFGGNAGTGGFRGNSGNRGFGGNSGSGGSGNKGFGGSRPNAFAASSADLTDTRAGKELSTVTAVKRPVISKPAVLGKFASKEVNNWDLGIWEKFGPGGFRKFNETLGPEVCQRPGLFRHPTDCTQFYECYWDKWIEKFTLHIFPCPVAMAVRQYDESISACNWPFLGPNCEGNTLI